MNKNHTTIPKKGLNCKKSILSTCLLAGSLFFIAGFSVSPSSNSSAPNNLDSHKQKHQSLSQIQAEQNKKNNDAIKSCQFSSNNLNNIKALKLLSKTISIGFYNNPRGYDSAVNVINTIKDWSVANSHNGFDSIKNKIIASAAKQKVNATMDWDNLKSQYYSVFKGYYAHTNGETKYADSTQFKTDPTTNPTLAKNTYLMPYFDLLKISGTQDQYNSYKNNLVPFKLEQLQYATDNSPLDNSLVGNDAAFDGSSLSKIFNEQEGKLVSETKNPNNAYSNNFSYTANNKTLVNTLILDTGANGVPFYGYVYAVKNGTTQSYWISVVIGGFVLWLKPNDQTTAPDLSKGINDGYLGLPVFSDRFCSNFFNSAGYKSASSLVPADPTTVVPRPDFAIQYHQIDSSNFTWSHPNNNTLIINFGLKDTVGNDNTLNNLNVVLPTSVPLFGGHVYYIAGTTLNVTISSENMQYDKNYGLTKSPFPYPDIKIDATLDVGFQTSCYITIEDYFVYYDSYNVSGFTTSSDKNIQFSATKNYFVLDTEYKNPMTQQRDSLGKSVLNVQFIINPITGGIIYSNDMGAADDTMPGPNAFNLAGLGLKNGSSKFRSVDPNKHVKIFAGTQNVYTNFDPSQGPQNYKNWPITFASKQDPPDPGNGTDWSQIAQGPSTNNGITIVGNSTISTVLFVIFGGTATLILVVLIFRRHKHGNVRFLSHSKQTKIVPKK